MAYNREWDQGKDAWGSYGQWNEAPGAGHVRERDDDYYGEGKRRKINDGGYDAQAYNSGSWQTGGPQGLGQGHAQGQQADPGGNWGQNDKNWAFKKRLVASEPSAHVIFLGLDPDFTEADLQNYLTTNGGVLESVTIIRDRSTGLSKGFGFAQFANVDGARKFVDPNFPFVQIPPPASHGASASAAFYAALESGAPHNGRRVKIDYSQSASPGDRARRPQNANDGTRDIGNTAAPVLLFRGLDTLSGPQAITQAMKSSSGPGKEGAKGMKRIILIKDKATMQSWGFCFVEFVDQQSASATLAATMSPQIHPTGFRISDRPVSASFAHPYSFQPADAFQRDEATLQSSMSLGGVEGGWVRYWDESSTVAVAEFEVQMPTPSAPVKDKKEKKKKVAEEMLKPVSVVEASALPVSDKPVTLSFNKSGIALNKAKTDAQVGKAGVSSTTLAMGDGEDEEETEDAAKSAAEAKVAAARKVPPMIASSKTANNITKWNRAQGELSHPIEASTPATAAPAAAPAAAAPKVSAPASASSAAPTAEELSFPDATGKICLLCARQFKTPEQLGRHNKESDLHKKNFADASLREVARGKVAASVQKAAATASAASASATPPVDAPKYRDRASERRVMHNQPDVPLPEPAEGSGAGARGAKHRFAEGPPAPPSPPAAPVAPGKDENNVGNKLLRMMGWTEGTGLGASGEGRVDPIQTSIFAQGVGLGASKGAEVGKYAEGYAGYVQKAQDAARDRYNQ